jgi:hypothetical protein
MFDCCDEGLDSADFQECIKEEFCRLWQKKDMDYFKTASFIEKLDFVCGYHLKIIT